MTFLLRYQRSVFFHFKESSDNIPFYIIHSSISFIFLSFILLSLSSITSSLPFLDHSSSSIILTVDIDVIRQCILLSSPNLFLFRFPYPTTFFTHRFPLALSTLTFSHNLYILSLIPISSTALLLSASPSTRLLVQQWQGGTQAPAQFIVVNGLSGLQLSVRRDVVTSVQKCGDERQVQTPVRLLLQLLNVSVKQNLLPQLITIAH